MAGSVEDQIVVVLGKEREHKAGYFDEIKDLLLQGQIARLGAQGVDPFAVDPRSGRTRAETAAINQVVAATGAGRSLARSWWECLRTPEPRSRWDLVENLAMSRDRKARLHRDSGVLRLRGQLIAEPGAVEAFTENQSRSDDFWQSMSGVLRRAHERHNFSPDPGEQQSAKQQAIAAGLALVSVRSESLASISAQADAYIRLRELLDHAEERRNAARDAVDLSRQVYAAAEDATRLAEALRVSALEVKDHMPELAVRRLAEMVSLREHARLPDSWWLTSALDTLTVLLIAHKSYWVRHLAGFEAETRSLEEELNTVGLAWAGLMARRLLGLAYREAGDLGRAGVEIYRAIGEYEEMPGVGAYHVRLARQSLASIERASRAERSLV